VCQCGAWAYDDKKKAFCPNCGKASTCGAAGGKPQHDTSEKEDTKEDKQLLQQAKALVQSLLPKLDDAQRIELQNKLPPELLPPSLSGHDLYKQAAKGNKEANIKLREAYQKKQDLMAKREKLQQQLATVEEQLEAIQGQVEKAEVEDQQATQNLAKVAKDFFEAAGQGHGTAKEAETEQGKTGEEEGDDRRRDQGWQNSSQVTTDISRRGNASTGSGQEEVPDRGLGKDQEQS